MIRMLNDSSNVAPQGLPLDQLPLEVSSKSLWSYVIPNGDGPRASLVCKEFTIVDWTRLASESHKILQDAENSSGLYSSIWARAADKPLDDTRESLYQFHEFIVKKIQVLGGGEIAVPQRPLTAKEVFVKYEELEDRALEKIWLYIADAILSVHPNLEIDLNWEVSEILNWIADEPEEFGEIRELDLASLEDLSMLPREIGGLENLTNLNLAGNQFSELPAEIRCLINLTELNVNHNQLTELSLGICHLRKLTSLHFGGNRLSELPVQISQLTNLAELDLSNNKLSGLPQGIGQLGELVAIWIDNNQLGEFPVEISQLTNLREIHASHNKLRGVPDELRKLTNLIHLNVSENEISEIPLAAFNLARFARVDLSKNPIAAVLVKLQEDGVLNPGRMKNIEL